VKNINNFVASSKVINNHSLCIQQFMAFFCLHNQKGGIIIKNPRWINRGVSKHYDNKMIAKYTPLMISTWSAAYPMKTQNVHIRKYDARCLHDKIYYKQTI